MYKEMRKTYSFPGITSGIIQIPVGKASVKLNFAKGCLDKKMCRPALFTTDDRTLQSIIEGSSLFGNRIFLYKSYGTEEVEEPVEESVEETSYPEVTTFEDAVKVLKSIPGVRMTQLKTPEAAKKVATAKGVVFPNYNFE